MNFVVLCSSRGTTFQATLDRIADGSLNAKCLGLVTDSEDRLCIKKAEAAGLPWKVARKKKGEDRADFDRRVDSAIEELMADADVEKEDTILAEMGWLWIHSRWFVEQWPGKILNVHPALLPMYGGEGMYGDHVHQAVLEGRESQSGITIHIVDHGVDTGPIVEQKICTIESDETVETLKDKVQALEKEWYPKTLEKIHTGELKLS